MRIVDFIRNGRLSTNKDGIIFFLVNEKRFDIVVEQGIIDSVF